MHRYADINYFRRDRACEECGKEFSTVEIDENFLNEIADLRDLFHHMKTSLKQTKDFRRMLNKYFSKIETQLAKIDDLPTLSMADEQEVPST